MTRLVAVGEHDSKLKEIYSIVYDALENALSGIKVGITRKEANALTRDVISAKGYVVIMDIALGVGLDYTSMKIFFINPTCELLVEEGMVLEIEPDIYIPGLGAVRIEDDIIMKKDGNEIIMKSPKELIIVWFEHTWTLGYTEQI